MFGQARITQILQLSKPAAVNEAAVKLLNLLTIPTSFVGFSSQQPWWSFWFMMTNPIAGPSTSTTGSGVFGSGLISMIGNTVGIAPRSSIF